MRRAERHAGLGHPVPAGLARRQGDAEVGHQRLAVVQQDVLGLDVAVDHPVPVGVVERGGHLARDPHRLGDGELLLPVEPGPERLALDERHDVEEEAVGLARVEQRQDVRVLEVGGELDLGQEPLGADDGRELGAEQLERDPPVVAEVLGQVDGGHAAGADLALDPVAVGQGELEAALRLGHAAGLWWGWQEDGGGVACRGRVAREARDARARIGIQNTCPAPAPPIFPHACPARAADPADRLRTRPLLERGLDTSSGLGFVRERLALLAKTLFLVSFGFYLFLLASLVLVGGAPFFAVVRGPVALGHLCASLRWAWSGW